MKFAQLILKNLLRHRRRTATTVLGIAVSLFLFMALLSVLESIDLWSDRAGRGQRLCVHHKMGFMFDIPQSYATRVRNLLGVVEVCPFSLYGGRAPGARVIISTLAVDPATLLAVWPENVAPPAVWEAFRTERTGAVVARGLAEKLGWKTGDEVTLEGTFRPVDLKFKICGVLDECIDPNGMFLRRDYLEESLGNPGIITNLWVKVERASDVPRVIRQAEEMFANSTYEVRAESEKSFIDNMMSMAGNIRLMVGVIGMVVVLSIMMVAANSVAMSVRERTGEVAVMKAIGFSRRLVLTLIVVEAMTLGLSGGFLGCFGGYLFFSSPALLAHLGPGAALITCSGSSLGNGMLVSLVIGFIAGFVPAWGVARTPVAEALRRVV